MLAGTDAVTAGLSVIVSVSSSMSVYNYILAGTDAVTAGLFRCHRIQFFYKECVCAS